MSRLCLYLIIVSLLFPKLSLAQTALPESKRSSVEMFVYKLTEKDMRKLYLKEKYLDESMLHTYVLRCNDQRDIPELPRGNYILVRAVENNLEYSDYTVDNFYYRIVEDEKVMLFLSDTLGNTIDNAVAKQGLKRLKFDKNTKTYNTSRIGNEKIVEVNNNGVLHYIEFEKEPNYYRTGFFRTNWNKTKLAFYRIFAPQKAPIRNKYSGFVVFSKPKYKPGETVKFKAYITGINGRAYKEKADVALVSNYPVRVDTTLVTLSPYRPGMYEWEFVLSDSLKLRLDNNYQIILKTKGERTNDIFGNFYYEEYELGHVTFDAKTDRKRYIKRDTVRVRFSADDENGMPIYDGRVDVTIRPMLNHECKYHSHTAFVPDEVWQHSLNMEMEVTKELILPDSIFVNNVSMYYNLECSFFDADNEKHTQNLTIYMDRSDRLIDFSVEKGVLTIKELDAGKSISGKAEIIAYNPETEIVYRDSVMLPYSLPLLWIADGYEVTTETSSGYFSTEDIRENILGYNFFRAEGYAKLIVDNPAGFPFWYTIRKGRNIIDKGYTTELNWSHQDRGKNGYTMQLSYLLGETARTIQGSLPYMEKNLSMDINTVTTVYPGQTAKVHVAITDKKGRPVHDADITAYAFTSKFGFYSPEVPIFGKSVFAKRFGNRRYTIDEEGFYKAKSPMDWEIWRQRMGLDSIEYYKFLYPEPFYIYSEKVKDGVTQISPYVVIDGKVQGVHVLWIDEQPHYFHQAQQLDIYSFPVTPGKHTLKLRIYDREIVVDNVHVEKGAKTIISINGKRSAVHFAGFTMPNNSPVRIIVNEYRKKNKGVLSKREMETLKDHLITVENTFGTVTLPNDYQSIDIPAIINAGDVYYYLNNSVKRKYNYTTRTYTTEPVFVGPFPYRGFVYGGKNIGTLYLDTMFVSNFEIEGGYRYSIWEKYLKQQNWAQNPISRAIRPFTPTVSFTRNALTPEEITETFHSRIADRAEQRQGLMTPSAIDGTDDCRLNLETGNWADRKVEIKPMLICLSHQDDPDSLTNYYYGATRNFTSLKEGKYRIDLVFRDSTRHHCFADLRKKGTNYVKIDSIVPVPNDTIGLHAIRTLDSNLIFSYPPNPLQYYNTLSAQQDSATLRTAQNTGGFNADNYKGNVITGTVRDKEKEPMPGVIVIINGTEIGTVTDINGKFKLPDTGSGSLTVSYIGFIPLTVRLISGYNYNITLKEDSQAMDEVVVMGFGGVNANSEVLVGKSAGIMVRGVSSASDSTAPLIIVNGVPYDGVLSDIDAGNIASINVVKDANTAIYGSRAASGIIFIETKDAMRFVSPDATGILPEGWSSANSLRTNFRDDAFWYPNLSTGKDGTVTFEVTYPDDITSWNVNLIAVGGRKQTDKAQLNIRSFKPLNAQLSLPQFALLGDSLNVVGRLTNHLNDTVQVRRSIEVGEHVSEDEFLLPVSHIDNIPVVANTPDSIKVTYSLTMENGYSDGERRAIPVYSPGVLDTHGEFIVINDTAGHRFATNPLLGKVTIHAETSAVQLLLDEIEKVDRYPYMCNEQMASKIKTLLSEKRICAMFHIDFKENNKIGNLIGKLNKNKNNDNLWGWWNKDKTELWISKQVVEAMLDAEAEGYKINFDKQAVVDVLIRELDRRLSSVQGISTNNYPVKHELLNLLELLGKLEAKINYVQYISLISSLPDATFNDRLRSMEIKLAMDTSPEGLADSLLNLASVSLMGALYWEEKEDSGDALPRRFLLPSINNIENTLTAYRTLRQAGGYDTELERIRSYFFEMRRNGSWQNTYESSRILETIMPDILKEGSAFREPVLTINGKRMDLPLTKEFPQGEVINVRKEGSLPVFFTVYQQGWNNSPEKASEGFAIETTIYENEEAVTVLRAGKSVELKASVSVGSDAEYVMIEVPIPAGCSFESKSKGRLWKETHREYHKEKVVIFCDKLPKGKHDFSVMLLPRYTGVYQLNPAKIELMYYPTFYGREKMNLYHIN